MSIKQAIEARALRLADSRLEDERGTYEWSLDAEITLRECAAALAALRSMPAEPVATFQPDELEQIVDRYLDEYELIGEDCNGLSGCYAPTDTEKALIKDAICGLLADSEWDAAWGRQIDAARATPHTAPLSDAWQPIETAPKNKEKALYWVVPKTRDEAYLNTSGEPIVSATPPHIFYGLHGGWSSLEKATLWQPVIPPPIERAILGRGGEQ